MKFLLWTANVAAIVLIALALSYLAILIPGVFLHGSQAVAIGMHFVVIFPACLTLWAFSNLERA